MYSALKFCLLVAFTIATLSLSAQEKSYAVAANNAPLTNYSRTNITDPFVKVKFRGERSVSLLWQAFTGDVSQYVLERSVDGRKFQEIGAFVTVMNNDEPYFEFVDRFRSPYMGPLFYRVRVEGLDGGIVYTPVTILKAVNLEAATK